MSDNLRLRTALALGWKHRPDLDVSGVAQWWKHGDSGRFARVVLEPDRTAVIDTMPRYGQDWASCGEVDAAIRERGWQWESQNIHDEIGVMIYKGLLNATIATAPTFPAAFAEAFCKAVERGHADQQ